MESFAPKSSFTVLEKRAADAPKSAVSAYLFTLNSNRTVEQLGPEGVARFKAGVEKIFSRPHLLLMPCHGTPSRGAFKLVPAELIDSIDVRGAYEEGPKLGKLHFHGVLLVRHRTRLQLDYGRVQALIREEDGLQGANFKADFLRNAGADIAAENYVRKPDLVVGR